jgi:hypothetical protein
MTADAAAQLRTELGGRAHALATLVGGSSEVWAEVPGIIERLAGDDDRQAAQTSIDVMAALWPDGTEPPPEWWHSPLGRLVARSVGTDDAEAVTYSATAAMLGVTIGTIKQLAYRGTLDRHPDGGVLRSSILQRLARG